MTISNEVYRHDYAGNDSTVLFAIGFYFLVNTHIKAILYNSVTDVETELTLTTHYTLTGAGNVNGGELTMITAPTSDESLTILRNVDVKQEKNYVEGTSFPAEDHEEALDKLTMLVQQIQEEIERGLRLAKSQPGIQTLPTPIAEYFLRYNAAADAFENFNITDLSLYTVSAFVETLLDDADASAILTTLGFSTFVKTLLDDVDASAFLTTLSLDTDLLTLALPADTTISDFVKTFLDDADASAARNTLGVSSNDNILINQDFSIWQENTTFSAPTDGVYTADGYYISNNAGGGTLPTINVKKNTVNMEVGFKQCIELEITNVGASGATRVYMLSQKVEDYKKYAGKTVVLSIRVKASTVTALSDGRMMLYDGIAAQTIAITSVTTSWVTYKIPITINNSATQLWARFELLSGSNSTISTTGSIYIQWMKCELGSVNTPLIPRRTGNELRLCQRYYQKSYAQGTFPGASTQLGTCNIGLTNLPSATYQAISALRLPVVMKAAPTVTLYDIVGNSGKATMASGNNIVANVTNTSDGGFTVDAANTSAQTNSKLQFHYTAVSRI